LLREECAEADGLAVGDLYPAASKRFPEATLHEIPMQNATQETAYYFFFRVVGHVMS
jgi:hypothetical protein